MTSPAVPRDGANRTLRLPDGRQLGYAERGAAEGIPLFFFHGTPGARTVLPIDDPIAESVGVRIIVPDRPGYGLSSWHRSRTLSSWADDVHVLADHLGIERFAVAGASGGGPYALACAARLPERVTTVGLVCTAGRFEGRHQLRSLSVSNRLKFAVPRWAPWLLRVDLKLCGPLIRRRPRWMARLVVRTMADEIRGTHGGKGLSVDIDRTARVAALLEEAFRQGTRGLYTDLVLASRDWDIDLERIAAPVQLWHGARDTVAPISMARALAAALPTSTTHVLPDAGHLILDRPDVWHALLLAAHAAAPTGTSANDDARRRSDGRSEPRAAGR